MRSAFILASTMALAACSGGSMNDPLPGEEVASTGSGAARSYDARGFERVSLNGPDRVEIGTGRGFAVRAEGDPDVLHDLRITIDGNRLVIGRAQSSWSIGDDRATIFVTMPEITGVAVNGSGDILVADPETESFEASIGGSGDIEITGLRAQSTSFSVGGSGSIDAAGTTGDMSVKVGGSGDIDASQLRAERFTGSIGGSGEVTGFVTESAEASIGGSGDIELTGGATCQSSIAGSGKLSCE